MKKAEVLEALCKITTRVGAEVFDYQKATDCICSGEGCYQLYKSCLHFEKEIIDFISQAVEEKIERQS